MLDQATKKRIDDARNILVGVIPNPQSQVEQITIALIYKFMDDMDQESIAMGGEASFFVDEFERYSWSNIFDARKGGYEILNLYAEAIERMDINPHIPQLFRDIFKNAYLPYRDPEILKLFLKTINEFQYDHSERLGDAFEYLLSVLSSQGDAGQFRTPRHIIEFMVQVVAPQKHETILDPACGTAGFLISAYKYIRHSNSHKNPGDLLTVQDRERMVDNFTGYDISPDMVRLSLVNMYLHGFVTPQIYEYDTLTSEERWNEYADVILANPPFMSPKGGIRPHKKFSVQSKRSEVLFVDYMAEHLTPDGRAAIIIPEGIIFKSDNAYKSLRKNLIEKNFLWAVVSLPSGVFNPYAGVKTSILFLDKILAKKTDRVLFVKVENDGYDLGAQRRPIDKNDLPAALKVMQAWQQAVQESGGEEFETTPFSEISALLVEKVKLAENGEYNFSGDRYKEISRLSHNQYPLVKLEEVCQIISGQSPKGEFYNDLGEGTPFYQGKTEFSEIFIKDPTKWTTQVIKRAFKDDILMSVRAPVGPVNIATQEICIGRGLAAIRANKDKISHKFLFYLLREKEDEIKGNSGAVFASINKNEIGKIKIPLPSLETQQEIVEEVEGYQRIIDGARMVVDNWKPNIELELEEARKDAGVDEWELVKLGDLCEFQYGKPLKAQNRNPGKYPVFGSNGIIGYHDDYLVDAPFIVIGRKGSAGKVTLSEENGFPIDTTFFIKLDDKSKIKLIFLYYLLKTLNLGEVNVQAGVPGLNRNDAYKIPIPMPPMAIQKQMIEKIEDEKRIIDSNNKLIEIYEKKIKKIVNQIWEE